MRIPSQFNEDSLYRGKKQRRARSGPSYRRLLSLFVALVMVVMVMHRARQPQVYETFFGSPPVNGPLVNGPLVDGSTKANSGIDRLASHPPSAGDPFAGDPFAGDPSAGDTSFSDPLENVADVSQYDTIRDDADRVVQELSLTQQRDWLSKLSGQSKNDADESGPSLPFLDHDNRRQREQALTRALAEAAMNRVVDGSVWRGDDADALYFQLAHPYLISSSPRFADAAIVSVPPLLQQPDVYRGQPVRFAGMIVKAETIEAAENDFGIKNYWQLWMLPAGGGDRPLVAAVANLPKDIEASLPAIAGGEPKKAEVVGRFLKRLAYRSSIGADLAPVVVGSFVIQNRVESSPAVNVTPIPKARLMAGVILACLIGLTLAVVTMWRTAVSARRARELRQSNTIRSATFLEQLKDVDENSEAKL